MAIKNEVRVVCHQDEIGEMKQNPLLATSLGDIEARCVMQKAVIQHLCSSALHVIQYLLQLHITYIAMVSKNSTILSICIIKPGKHLTITFDGFENIKES